MLTEHSTVVEAWPEAALLAVQARFKDLVRPFAAGDRLQLFAGAPVLGFHPMDFAGTISFRWLGPDPKAIVFIGKLDPRIRSLLLVLAARLPVGVEPPRLAWNGMTLDAQDIPLPEAWNAAVPGGVALRAQLPLDAAAPDSNMLRLRLNRTVPEPGVVDPQKLVGLALHAIIFEEGAVT